MSARYCAASCQAVGVAYGEDSIEWGNELFKLAQLYFNRWIIHVFVSKLDNAWLLSTIAIATVLSYLKSIFTLLYWYCFRSLN